MISLCFSEPDALPSSFGSADASSSPENATSRKMNPGICSSTQYILLIMPESSKILGPTWVKNRPRTTFSSHLEPSGGSEMDSQYIFGPDWARQSSERPQNGPKINRFPLIVPEWLKRNTQ